MNKKTQTISLLLIVGILLFYFSIRYVFPLTFSDDISDILLYFAGGLFLVYLGTLLLGLKPPSNQIKKRITITFLSTSFLLSIFGYWGLFTNAGQKKFDEMSGAIPFYGLLLAVSILASCILLNTIWMIKSKTNESAKF